MDDKTLTIFTDGASRGNPGPAAAAAIFCRSGKFISKTAKFLGEKTNNQAEYEALIMALKEAKKLKAKKISCFLDSELIVRQLNHKYKIKDEKIIPLFIKVWNLMIGFESVEFAYVPREKNRQADTLANQLLDAQARGKLL